MIALYPNSSLCPDAVAEDGLQMKPLRIRTAIGCQTYLSLVQKRSGLCWLKNRCDNFISFSAILTLTVHVAG